MNGMMSILRIGTENNNIQIDNRGIQNPYTEAHRGRVLDAYYEMEGLRLELENAVTFEDELDTLNASLENHNEQLNIKNSEYEKSKPLKDGIQRRSSLEHKLEDENSKKGKLLDISKRWPVLEYRIENADPEIKKKQEKLEELNRELEKARNAAKAIELKKRIDKLVDLSEKIEDAREKLKSTLKVEQAYIYALRELESDIRRFKAQIAAAKLTVRISSESERKLRYSEAGKEVERNIHRKRRVLSMKQQRVASRLFRMI
jgi:DNA repair protein SbcC/Rad50